MEEALHRPARIVELTMSIKKLILLINIFSPWPIRRWLLEKLFGYRIHPTSRIGLAWVFPRHLVMEAYSSIGHLTVCKGLDLLWLKESSIIGRANWITGFPSGESRHFRHQPERKPQLILGEHSAVTNRHLLDCTNTVTVGKFTTVAGFRSQVLTHSIDLERNMQSSFPISIGDYCFVGTNCVLLGGSTLPDYSVLGAMSLLNKRYDQCYCLYAGVPAKACKTLSKDYGYFNRATGFVE